MLNYYWLKGSKEGGKEGRKTDERNSEKSEKLVLKDLELVSVSVSASHTGSHKSLFSAIWVDGF